MIEPAAEIGRRLRRDARQRVASRLWAGWKFQLTHGPYEDAFDPETRKAATEVASQLLGEAPPTSPEAKARMRLVQQGVWHLSASWRGGFPVEEGRACLAELLAALGVPEDKRDGYQAARTFGPNGANPQVTHWTWNEET